MASTIVASYDWTSDTWTHNGDNPTRTAWRAAVSEIAEKTKATLPECNGRVDSAVKIVLNGDVDLQADGTAKVASQSNGQTAYHIVNGSCDCKDFPKAPSNWCKHRIAAGLALRARALAKQRLEQLGNVHNGASQPPAEPAQVQTQREAGSTLPLPEAPVSITLKATLNGHDVMVTLRGVDFASVKAQVEQASQWLSVQAPAQPPTQPPTQGTTPHAHHDSPYCHAHKAVLKRYERNGQVWYSHKTADGRWCRGK
jgi:hypothetical protein